jgi:radical SAM superfamily enzyme YgiQ (UPF0313 family)
VERLNIMIIQNNPIPTGYLFTSHGERGELETLSIGDYGKKYNIKADFLGFKKEISGVPNVPTMPLSEKWVITVSTQYGCTQKCTFCFLPGTEILMDDNTKKFIEDIVVDDYVSSYDNKNIISNKVSKLFVNDYDGDVITITIEDGTTLTMTPDHPILVNRYDGFVWISASDLLTDMEIVKIDKYYYGAKNENQSNNKRTL